MDRGIEPFVTESQTEEHRTVRESLKRKHVDDYEEYEPGDLNTPFDVMSTCATNPSEEYYGPPAVKKPLLSNEMCLPSKGEPDPEISNPFKIPENKGAPRKIVMPKKRTPTIMLPTPGIVYSAAVSSSAVFSSAAVTSSAMPLPVPVQIVRPVVDHYPQLPMMYALPLDFPQTSRVPQPQTVIEREIERNKWKNFLAWENKYNYYGALYTKREEQH